MKLIRYRTHPEHTAHNAELIKAVFAALRVNPPDELRYASVRLPDGTHFHLVENSSEDLTSLPAFQEFQRGIRDRCLEPPTVHEVTVLGAWRMLGA